MIFELLRDALLTIGDRFMHLADLTSYPHADAKLCQLHRKPNEWTEKVILNLAGSGKFSSDRTIGSIRAGDLGRKTLSGKIASPTNR